MEAPLEDLGGVSCMHSNALLQMQAELAAICWKSWTTTGHIPWRHGPVTWERAGKMHLLCSQAARKENSEVPFLLAQHFLQGSQVRKAFLLSWKYILSPIHLPDIISQSLFYFLMGFVSGFPCNLSNEQQHHLSFFKSVHLCDVQCIYILNVLIVFFSC